MKITRLPCPLWCISLRQSLGCGWLLLIMSHRYDPPTGIALAVILIFGYRYWPAILIGALAVLPLPRNSYTLLRVCAHEHAAVAQRHACWDRGHHFAQEVSWSAVFIPFLWRSVSIY
jgi:hypothetical protein